MPVLPVTDQMVILSKITSFMAEYVHTVDADRLEDWPGLFTEDAVYRVCTRENHDRGLPLSVMSCRGRGMLGDRISALRTANVYEPHVYCHVIGAVRILEDKAGRVRTESNFQVIRTMADGAMSLYACGHALDTFSIVDETVRLSERIVILDSRQIDTLLVIPL
ncbi:MAG: aromatic-ring-hydroxylating dioxygenase subunit beta [Hyphomicrobiales bacterium]